MPSIMLLWFLGSVGLLWHLSVGIFYLPKCVLGFVMKLFGAIGAWCGLEKLPYILLLGSF